MYINITEECKEVISRSSRTFAASFVVNQTEYEGVKSYKVSVPSTSDGKVTIGSTLSLNLELISEQVSIAAGNKLELIEYIKLDNGTYEGIPMGKFTILSAVTKDNLTTISGAGPLSVEAVKAYFSYLTYPATTIQMLNEISMQIGISIDVEGLEEIYVETKPEGYTCREIIGYIAAMHGTNAYETRSGGISFKFHVNSDEDIFTDKIDSPEISNDLYIVNKFECATGSSTITRGNGTAGIQISNPLMTEASADVVWSKISGFRYRPGTFNIKSGTPCVDPWDSFTYEDDRVICTELDYTHDGGLQNIYKSSEISGVQASIDYKGPTATALNRFNAELVLVNEALVNKLSVEQANILYLQVAQLEGIEADIEKAVIQNLETEFADIHLANIDTADVGTLLATVGLITSAVIVDGHVTGYLDSVEINANTITAGTLAIDRLIIRGSENSLVYELNNITGALQSINVDTLNGEIITDRTISVDKIVANSITANELNITDIFGNSAVIKTIFAQDIEATGTIRGVTLQGTKGEIGGWYISDYYMEATEGRYSDNTIILCANSSVYPYAIMAGVIDYGIETEPYAPFMVGFDGSVYLSKMYASGGTIGNLIIGINSLYYGTESITSDDEGVYIGTDGFRHVGTNGKVTVAGGKIVSDIGTINTINAIDTSDREVRMMYLNGLNNAYIADGVTGNVYIGNVNGVSEIRLLSQSMVALQTGVVRIGANAYTAGSASNGVELMSSGNINLSSYGTPSYIQFHFNNSQTGTAMISESARGEIKITGSLITTGTISTNGNIRLDNNNALYIKDAQGTYRGAVTLDSDNVYRYGSGGMANNIVIGTTDYTASVYIRSKGYIHASTAGIRIGEEDSAGTTSNGTLIHKGYIELSRSAPYIDFHYGEDTGDYTSRIVEETSGRLFISGALRLGSNLIMPNNVSIQARNTSGTAYALMYLNSYNNVMIGHSSLATYYNSLNHHTFRTGSSNSVAAQINSQPGAYFVDLRVGNSEGPDKMSGRLILYGSGKGYTSIQPLYNGVSAVNINFPASSGTLAIASSDIRLKENVIDSDINALDVINQIQIRAFNWKETGERQSIGFIADELEEIDSKMVVEGTGGYFEDGTLNVKTVDMFYLMGYLCKGEQELYYEIMRLKKELNEIKKTV